MFSLGRTSPIKDIILQSCVDGDISMVQSLMALDPFALNVTNSYNLSLVQIAVIHRHEKLAEYLITSGISLSHSDNKRWTPLHDAALFGPREVVEMLIQYGANVLAKNREGEMPLDLAADDNIEKLLCDKMEESGHGSLVRRYKCGLGDSNEGKDDAVTNELNNCILDDGQSSGTGTTVSCQEVMSKDYEAASNKVGSYSQDTVNNLRYSLGAYVWDNSASNEYTCTVSVPYKSSLCTVFESSFEESTIDDSERAASACSDSDSSVLFQQNIGSTTRSHMLSHLPRSQSYDAIGLQYLAGQTSRLNTELIRSSSDLAMRQRGDKCAETPIELLKMRPRKPSLVDANRRRSHGDDTANRRSVSFQPEVLLQELVTEGDSVKVKEVINSGLVGDINKMSPVGLTALHQCAIDGNLDCAQTLVYNGADVNSIDIDGWSPLHAAAASNHVEIVRFFLTMGANPSLKNNMNKTPYNVAKKSIIRRMLFRAASGKTIDPTEDDISDGDFSSDDEEEDCSHAGSDTEDEEEPTSLSDNETSSLNDEEEFPSNLFTPRGSIDSVFSENIPDSPPILSPQALLKDNRLFDSTSSYESMLDGESHRHDVAFSDDIETSSIGTLCNDDLTLIDTDRDTDQGFSTMDASSDSSNRKIFYSDDEVISRDVLDVDLDHGTIDYKFQEAILNGDVDAVVKLVKSKGEIDVNRVNKTSGISALHHSVLEENFALVQHLVCDFKCDPNLKDTDGWTPLHAASAVGNIRIAQFLLENGAKASILNNNCEFPVDVTDEEKMSQLLKKAMLGPTVGKLFKGIFR
jgi:ankyrin repeat protein